MRAGSRVRDADGRAVAPVLEQRSVYKVYPVSDLAVDAVPSHRVPGTSAVARRAAEERFAATLEEAGEPARPATRAELHETHVDLALERFVDDVLRDGDRLGRPVDLRFTGTPAREASFSVERGAAVVTVPANGGFGSADDRISSVVRACLHARHYPLQRARRTRAASPAGRRSAPWPSPGPQCRPCRPRTS